MGKPRNGWVIWAPAVKTNTLAKNPAYKNEVITAGLGYFLDEAFVIKMDYEYMKNGNGLIVHKINAGIGFWFR